MGAHEFADEDPKGYVESEGVEEANSLIVELEETEYINAGC